MNESESPPMRMDKPEDDGFNQISFEIFDDPVKDFNLGKIFEEKDEKDQQIKNSIEKTRIRKERQRNESFPNKKSRKMHD